MKNFTTPALAALFLSAGLAVGCDQSASDTADAVKSMAGDAVEGAKDMSTDAADGAKKMAADAADGVKEMVTEAADDMKEMATDGLKKMTGGEAGEAGDMKKMAGDAMESAKGMDVSSLTEGMGLSEAQASSMLDKVKDLLSSGDTKGAAGLMEKLKNVELPASVQPQFDALKSTLDKAMEAGNALQSFTK